MTSSRPNLLVVASEHVAAVEQTPWITLEDIQNSSECVGSIRLAIPLEDVPDAWAVLRTLRGLLLDQGTLTVRYGSGSKFRLKRHDVEILLRLAGFHPVAEHREDGNRELIARMTSLTLSALSCTVVVPCRNEVDNVRNLVSRLPSMGTQTELIFVDGNSTDGTPERIQEVIRENPERDIKLIRQTGNTGKAGATFQGLEAAACDVVMILDADMTVRPEDLPRFYFALAEGVADFANGTRLVYPMAPGAMPGLNKAGNRAFSILLSWLTRSRITDTLCGTKAIRRTNIPKLLDARRQFGGHDPWGDFDLIMGAALLGLRIIDVPVEYESREAGESKMRPFAHGAALAQTCLIGVQRLRLHRRNSESSSQRRKHVER